MNLDTLPDQIKDLHHSAILRWQQSPIVIQNEGLLKIIEENHAYNFQLWQAEDRARREDKGHRFVYEAKREIDRFNQQRNNRMEAIDEGLARLIRLSQAETCPIHSETPGMIIDRLSILSLKSFYMTIQTKRLDVDATHLDSCERKLSVLHTQHRQLNQCLYELFRDFTSQTRTFRPYHQLKMYNDPKLNPELYS